MDSKSASSSSDIIDNIRKMTISRRGGVRTRGGRLPPISIREINQVTVKKENKKVIAPKIPQRRRTIKQEVEIKKMTDLTTSRTTIQDSRGRGRGRQPKVFLQMEGTFLAEGPAAKTKKDPLSYETLSFSRSRTTSKAGASDHCEMKYSAEDMKELLEFYDEFGAYENEYGSKPPYRLPLLKKKSTTKIKAEPKQSGVKKEEVKIKEEVKSESDEEGEKEKVIKTEKETDGDSDDDFIGRRKIKIKKEVLSDSEDGDSSESKMDTAASKIPPIVVKSEPESDEVKNFEDIFKNHEGNGKLILLQIPRQTSIPEAGTSDKSSKEEKKEAKTEQPEQVSTFTDRLEDGYIGKLQIMKSGRMRMRLGSAEFELHDGSESESYWEVVSIQVRDDGGDLAVLGKVEKKLILNPVLEMLLNKEQAAAGSKK